MKKILICQHGGSGNHGCEALARTTAALIAGLPEPCEVTLYSYRVGDDRQYMSDLTDVRMTGLSALPGRFSVHNISYHIKKRLGQSVSRLPITAEFAELVRGSDLVIAIGGDNYCYHRGEGYYALDRFIRDQGKPYMLLGCSIEPDDLPKGLAAHLRTFDVITARESITCEALRAHGLSGVVEAHDTAFLLPTVCQPLPEGFQEGNTVGINLSPLIQGLEGTSGITMENYRRLIRHILDTTEMSVALIPHVVWPDNDDRVPLQQLRDEFAAEKRVVMIPDADCRVLKGAISRLRFFVGARTHATIAAYSSEVPTLVVGYSVKARGIARDLFGTEEHYVLPVQELRDPEDLSGAFDWIMAHEDEMRGRLHEIMLSYRAGAEATGRSIARLLGMDGGEGLAEGVERPEVCSGCGACVRRCPVGAIRMERDAEGFLRPTVDREKCVRCGACRAVCPSGLHPVEKEPEVYCARAADAEQVRASSSGGIFSALAESVLAHGGRVIGAAWDRNGALRHTAADDTAALAALRGSKYVQSDMAQAYADAAESLEQHRPVLFCGTPCQAAAMRQTFGDAEGLLLVDVICHGVPTPELLPKYMDEIARQQGSAAVGVDFRDKVSGWKDFSVTTRLENGQAHSVPVSSDLFMKLFLGNVGLRPSCYRCALRGKTSVADLTLGDFWGAEKSFPSWGNDDRGLSLVLVHTEAGRRAWAALSGTVESRPAEFAAAAKYNPCLLRPVARPQSRERFLRELGKKPLAELTAEYLPQPSKRQRIKARVYRLFNH